MVGFSERTLRARAAIRVLYEQHGVDVDVIAAAARLTPEAIMRRVARENWTIREAISTTSVRTLSQRIGALADRLVSEIEAIERDGASAGYDKARIEAVAALTRALEKAGEIGEARMERQQEQKKTDADISELLGRMEDRIIELARIEADRLVAAELTSRQTGGTDR